MALILSGIAGGALCAAAAADLEAFVLSGDHITGELAAGGETETFRIACGPGDVLRANVRVRERVAVRVRLLGANGAVLSDTSGRNVRAAVPVPDGADEVLVEVSTTSGAGRASYAAGIRCGPVAGARSIDLRPAAIPAGATFLEAELVGRTGGIVAPSRYDAVAGTSAGFPGRAVVKRISVVVGAAPDIDPGVAGVVAAGPAVTYGPASARTTTTLPVRLTVPYRLSAVTHAVRVFRAGTDGSVAEIAGATADPANAVVHFDATRLGTFQVFDGPPPGDPAPGTSVIPTDARAFDRLGAIAVDGFGGGNRFVVGSESHREDLGGGGNFSEVGAAYVYESGPSGTWTPVVQLLAPDRTVGAKFGHAVAIDGDVIAVGAPAAQLDLGGGSGGIGAGSVHVFELVTGTWTETAVIPAPESAAKGFGGAVALQGDRLVIGAPLYLEGFQPAGAAFVYERGPSGWTQTAELEPESYPTYSEFGFRVALDGDTVLVGQPFDGGGLTIFGAAHTFRLIDGEWLPEQKITPPQRGSYEEFGADVALHGDRALIGAPGRIDPKTGKQSGGAYVFERTGGTWTMAARIDGPATGTFDKFGAAVSLDGDSALIGAPDASFATPKGGAAYLVRRGSGSWTTRSALAPTSLAANDAFGSFLTLSGNTAFVVAPDADGAAPNVGAVHVLDVSSK